MPEPETPRPLAKIAKLFALQDAQLAQDLKKARSKFDQSGNKGDAAEQALRSVLRDFLPRSHHDIGHGEIIDCWGRRSRQTDVVITNADQPLAFPDNLAGLFLIEGVAAAGEVKSVLTTTELDKALDASRQFKTLTVMHAPGSLTMSSLPDLNRFGDHPPWFLFAFESELAIKTIYERLVKVSGTGPTTDTKLLDAVFVLGKGYLVNLGDGKGTLQVGSRDRPRTGWVYTEDPTTTMHLLAWLCIVAPRQWRATPVLTSYILPSSPPD
jgi:hypothetical protein